MLRIIKENRKLRKENAELRRVIKDALLNLDDTECPIGIRILSAQCVLEEIIKVTEDGHGREGVKKGS